MKVTFNVPDGKVETLVAFYAQRWGTDPTTVDTDAKKKELISKFHETAVIDVLRALIQEQANIQAKAVIKADDDLKETPLEVEAKNKSLSLPIEATPE